MRKKELFEKISWAPDDTEIDIKVGGLYYNIKDAKLKYGKTDRYQETMTLSLVYDENSGSLDPHIGLPIIQDTAKISKYENEKCMTCKAYDGYDMCLINGNFGSITLNSVETCESNNYYQLNNENVTLE